MTDGGWLGVFGETGRSVLNHWLIVRRCAGCERSIDADWLCSTCRVEIDQRAVACPRCALPIGPNVRPNPIGCWKCRGRSLGFDAAVALGTYGGALQGVCLKLKHKRSEPTARRAADLLVESRHDELAGLGVDLVAPVPLFWWRRWRRGYNQAEALARRIAAAMGFEFAKLVYRVRPTKKLARLSPSARSNELKGSMALSWRAASRLKGRTVLLVDDILTTGATCGEVARVLKRGGAKRVVVAVLGRATGR